MSGVNGTDRDELDILSELSFSLRNGEKGRYAVNVLLRHGRPAPCPPERVCANGRANHSGARMFSLTY